MKFCCPQAQPVRGLTDGQRASNGPRVDVVKLAATPWAPSLVALAIFEELALLFLIAAGMVPWSPAGTRCSLPKIEEIGTM